MAFVTEVIMFAFMYVANVYQTFLHTFLTATSIGSRPDIFSIDKKVADHKANPQPAERHLVDFRSWSAAKASVGSILEKVVGPELGDSSIEEITSYDDKIDAVLALGVFFPDAMNKLND